jgi:hypothetical protein
MLKQRIKKLEVKHPPLDTIEAMVGAAMDELPYNDGLLLLSVMCKITSYLNTREDTYLTEEEKPFYSQALDLCKHYAMMHQQKTATR